MTTLAANQVRAIQTSGNRNSHPVIAAEIIFAMAAVGIVAASGHAQPLVAGDAFAGFAESQADNSAGLAAAINVEVYQHGIIDLTVAGVVITDVGQPVYATDDDTFTMNPVGGVFVGLVSRWVSSGVASVAFNAGIMQDPYGGGVYEEITGAKTLDALDSGKTFFVTATAVVTNPVTATALDVTLVCAGPFGTVQISVDPAAADSIAGPDSAGVDNKDRINTLATARRGDLISYSNGHAAGALVTREIGTWAAEA